MTERGAPHRETAQAPLCRFGRGLRVRSQALSVCGKIVAYRKSKRHRLCIQVRAAAKRNTLLLCFCGFVYGPVTKYQPALYHSGNGSGKNLQSPQVLSPRKKIPKKSPIPKWARSSFYISRGYHMHLSLSKLDCSFSS